MNWRALLLPPSFSDEEQTRIAKLLHWILIFLIGLSILDTILLAIFAPETSSTFWMNYLLIGICMACLWLMRRGWVRVAAMAILLITWGLMVFYFAISGGVMSPAFGLFAVLIVMGAMLLGVEGAILLGLLCIGSGIFLYIGVENGLLISIEDVPSASRLFATQTAIFVSLSIFSAMSSRSVLNALKRSRKSEKDLADQNQQLLTEIAQRQQAQQEQQRLTTILEATSDFVGIADANGNTLYLNHAGRDLLGLPDDYNLRELTVHTYYPLELAQQLFGQVVPNVIENGIWSGEMRLQKQNGEELPVSQVIIAHKDGEGVLEFLSTIIRDISPLKIAEENRLKLALQEDRLSSMKEFLSQISHDLRTPMAVIRTSASLLARYDEADKRQAKLETIQSQLSLLDKYIQDLLDLTRLDHMQEFKFESIELNKMIKQITAALISIAEEKKISLELEQHEDEMMIKADSYELERAIKNLLENAIYYTPSGGKVLISCEHEQENVILKISDTGIGIPNEELDTIFDRFHRSDNARQLRPNGTGLGLAIVKRIIEIHNGNISLSSEVGVGTTFCVTLPYATAI